MKKTTKQTTPRGKVLRVRMNDEEMDAVEQAAEREHLTTSSWVRSVLLKAATVALLFGGPLSGCGVEDASYECIPSAWSDGTLPDAYNLVVDGILPPHFDRLMTAAQNHCGRTLVGRLLLLPASFDGVHDGQSRVQGSECPLDAWAMSKNNGLWAAETPIAHEIGHWCLQSIDETVVERWAQAVNRDALTSMSTTDP